MTATHNVDGAPAVHTSDDDAVGFSMVPATYRWSFDGNELTFEVVGEDVLQPRNTTMSDRYVPLD